MSKYRIVQLNNGDYKLQVRILFFFWTDKFSSLMNSKSLNQIKELKFKVENSKKLNKIEKIIHE